MKKVEVKLFPFQCIRKMLSFPESWFVLCIIFQRTLCKIQSLLPIMVNVNVMVGNFSYTDSFVKRMI